MIRLIVFWATLHAAASAADLHIDLSGEWRRSTDDRPEYCSPDWDDTSWPVARLPRRRYEAPWNAKVYWLRRTVELPPDADRSGLALTIGPVRPVYELYVNGTRIGETGPFFDDRRAQIAYTRIFPVPPATIQGKRMVIAIRSRLVNFGSSSNSSNEGGSFLLSTMARAPHHEAQMMIDARKSRYSIARVFLPAILLCVGCLAFVLWLAERERPELFWLAVLILCRAASEWIMGAVVSLTDFPFSEFGLSRIDAWLRPLAFISLVELAFATHSWRVPTVTRAAIWISLLALGLSGTDGLQVFFGDIVVVFVLALAWLRQGGIRFSRIQAALGLIVGLLALYHMESNGGFAFAGIPRVLPTWFTIGSQEINLVSVVYVAAAVSYCLLSLHRLIQDRVEKQRLSGEMEAARVVQQFLLRPPESAGIDAVYRPAAEVGGDFWQAYSLVDGGHLLAVGDVSGKGLKAAMLVSLITGALRNRRSDEPTAVLTELNRVLCGGVDGGFVTAAVARFSPGGDVRIANAGHISPYLDGKEVEVPGGLPLGLDREASYEEHVAGLGPGQQLTWVSDGVIEAANAKGELFGFDRTRAIATQSAEAIAGAAKQWGQNDDITVVTVRRAHA